MKDIYLCAKIFASRLESSEIEMEHIVEAFLHFEIEDEEAREEIVSYFKEDIDIEFSKKGDISKSNLSSAQKLKKINFSSEVKLFKTHLNRRGYGLSKSISKLYENKQQQDLLQGNEMMDIVEKLNGFFENCDIYEEELAKERILDGFTEAIIADNKTPTSFLFCGDKSSGKSFLAKRLSGFFESEYDYKIMTLDMAKFTNDNQDMDITGTDKGYGSAGPGKVTSQVYRHPKTVLILENFDKAHHNVQDRFISIFSDGILMDSFGFMKDDTETLTKDNYDEALEKDKILYEVDFKDTIVILTTKQGDEVYKNKKLVSKLKDENQDTFDMLFDSITKSIENTDRLTKGISPSIVSSLSTLFLTPLFPINFESICNILQLSIEEKSEKIKNNFKSKISFKDIEHIVKLLVLSSGNDVRSILKTSLFKIFDPITDVLRLKNSIKQIKIKIDKNSKETIDALIDQYKSEHILKTFFRKNVKTELIVKDSIKDDVLTIAISTKEELLQSVKAEDYTDKSGSLVFEVPNISFDAIAGHKRAKDRLKEIVAYLKNPDKLKEFGVEIPRGMLLYGPPGTGKTMLAKAFSNEADLPFISTTGSEILDIELMKKIFKRAREYAPSIVFIDEIDAIGRRDGSGKDIVINQFLTELNGFSDDAEEMIFVVSATNLKMKIDDAILRSGRIDIHVEIDSLDRDAREYFMNKILEKPSQEGIDVKQLVTFTAGMTGADLEKVGREASLEAIRQGVDKITQEILLEQINTIKHGEKIFSKSIEKTLESTAYHEAGHAVLSKMLMPDVNIEQITVTPRGDALGFVSYDTEDRFGGLSYDDIKHRICIAFAGRVVQVKKFKEEGLDSGASNDLLQATKLAYYAIGILGMDEEIGYINTSGFTAEHLIGSQIENEVQMKVKKLLQEQKKRTFELVDEHWLSIEKVAKKLIEDEFLDEEEFIKIIK